MSELKKKLVFDESSPKEQYDELFKLEIGEIFKIQSDYETVMRRIDEYAPGNILFKVFPINPGTALYTLYGPDHCIVTDNRMLLNSGKG